MIKNVDNIIMVSLSEPIFQAAENANELDITYVANTSLKFYQDGYPDFERDGKPNIYAYHIKLMTKVSESSASKRKKLIDYQINIHMDPLKWLYEVEDLLNQNYYQFDERPNFQEAYEDILKIIAEKIFEIENPSSIKNTNEQKVKFDSYNKYIKYLDSNYLAHPSIMFYFSNLNEALEMVKKEILNNLIILTSEDKQAYFEKLKFEVSTFKNDHHDYSADIMSFQKKYKIKNFNILEAIMGENELYKILSFPDEVKDIDNPTAEEDEILSVRYAFYNYYYFDFLAQFLDFIQTQKEIYFPRQSAISFVAEIIWQKTDTDLLELITALILSGSINNQTKNLTRKDTIRFFETFFNIKIKDAENKLSKATSRKGDQKMFLNTLTRAFQEYCDKKDK